MEFQFNVNEYFKKPIVEIRNTLLPPDFAGDRRALWNTVNKVAEVVNEMGEASAHAQGLNKPITTAERLRQSDQSLYLLVDNGGNSGNGAVTGMLKIGKKGLYVFDREGQHYQVSPPCVLDFYVHEKRQRSGLGKKLFEFMLEKEKVKPHNLAIDRPSEKFLSFLNKHYSLQNPIKQMNNYVVFDGFFPDDQKEQVESSPINRTNGLQSTQTYNSPSYGRYGAPRPPCSMGQIIHNTSSQKNSESASPGVLTKIENNCKENQFSEISSNQIQNNNISNQMMNEEYCAQNGGQFDLDPKEKHNQTQQHQASNHYPLQEQRRMFPEKEVPMTYYHSKNGQHIASEIMETNQSFKPQHSFRQQMEDVLPTLMQQVYQAPQIISQNNLQHVHPQIAYQSNGSQIQQLLPLEERTAPLPQNTALDHQYKQTVFPSQYQNTTANQKFIGVGDVQNITPDKQYVYQVPTSNQNQQFMHYSVAPNQQQFMQYLPLSQDQNQIQEQVQNMTTASPQYSLYQTANPQYQQTRQLPQQYYSPENGNFQQQYYQGQIQRNMNRISNENQLVNQTPIVQPSYEQQLPQLPLSIHEQQNYQHQTSEPQYFSQEPILPSVPISNQRNRANEPLPKEKEFKTCSVNEPESVGSLLQVDPKYFKSDPIHLKQPPEIISSPPKAIQPKASKNEDTVASLLRAEEEYFENGLLRDKYRIPVASKSKINERYIRLPDHRKFCPHDHCIEHQDINLHQPHYSPEINTQEINTGQFSNHGISSPLHYAEPINCHREPQNVRSDQLEIREGYIPPAYYVPTSATQVSPQLLYHESPHSPEQRTSSTPYTQQVYNPEITILKQAQKTIPLNQTSAPQEQYFQQQTYQPNEYMTYFDQAHTPQQQLVQHQTYNIPDQYVITQEYQPHVNYTPPVPISVTPPEQNRILQQQSTTPQKSIQDIQKSNNSEGDSFPIKSQEYMKEKQQTPGNQQDDKKMNKQEIMPYPLEVTNTENERQSAQKAGEFEPQVMKEKSAEGDVSKTPMQRFSTTIRQNTFIASDSNPHGEELKNLPTEVGFSSVERQKKVDRMYGLNDTDMRRKGYRSAIVKRPVQSQERINLENGYPPQIQLVTKKRPPPRTILTMRGR